MISQRLWKFTRYCIKDVLNINFAPMRRPSVLLLLFVLCTTGKAFSQENLVRNPSFEQHYDLPLYIGDAPGSIQNWTFAGELGSGDYYHTYASGPYHIPDNHFGHEKARTGSAYAGFCVTPRYREFLSSQLTMKLEKGKKYRFTMYVSKGDNEEVSYLKEISVMFLSRPYVLNDDLVMGIPPQIVFYQDSGFTQTNGWQELTTTYIANGREEWIFIGAHQWKCDTCKSVPGTARKQSPGIFGGDPETMQAHYYVDDVSIVEVIDAPPADTSAFTTGVVYSFSNIHFATNSAVLQEGDQPELQKILSYLLAHPEMNVFITGHTDSIGDSRSNYVLSLQRAEAVKSYLVEHNIAAARISAEGAGETKFVAPNSTAEGRALNRRVEFLFTKRE